MTGQAAFFRALLDPLQPSPEGLTAWNGSSPSVRYAVYRNNVSVSLVDALADSFAVTQELVGETFFRAMSLQYVRAQPPRSAVLALYGESFPEFIAQFPPAASVPYLGAVARLEWLRQRAFHAADPEAGAAGALRAQLDDLNALPRRRARLHPALGLLPSRYAVVSLWAAHQGITEISTVDPSVPENALIIRPAFEVEVIPVSAAIATFIAQLLQGATLGTAAEQTAASCPQFNLTTTLAGLFRRQVVVSLI